MRCRRRWKGAGDDHLAERVEDGAAVDLAVPGGMFGDVGEPQLVGPRGGEVALYKVFWRGLVEQAGPAGPLPRQSRKPTFPHDRFNQFQVHDHVVVIEQRGPDTSLAVNPARASMNLADLVGDDDPANGTGGQGPSTVRLPRRSAKPGDPARRPA
jgi:hypothetical protein